MFEKLFGRFFKKKGGKAEKKKVPAPAKKEAVEESVGTEKSAQNEEASAARTDRVSSSRRTVRT